MTATTSSTTSSVSEAVTSSARSIAAVRALEHARGDGTRIFASDAYARAFAGEAAYARVVAKANARRRASSRGGGGGEDGGDGDDDDDARARCVDDGRVAIRTRFFDDVCERWTRETSSSGTTSTKERQIVFLGAGFDARCWRLRGSDVETTTAYELDDARVFAEKEDVVKDATLTLVARRRVVRCDLERDDWFDALVRAGYDATLSTLFVLEGLMYYLSPRRARRLTRECAARSGPASAMVVSVVNPAALRRATREPLRAKLARVVCGRGKPKTARQSWKSSCDVPPEAYFDAWDVDTVGQLGDDILHYGRWTGKTPTEYPRDARAYRRETTPRTFYVFARKRDDDRQSRADVSPPETSSGTRP